MNYLNQYILSIPEAKNEEFDFLDFLKDESMNEYTGNWNIYIS